MADVKAYAINQIKRAGENVPASTKEAPSIFSIDEDGYNRLEKLGAARKPTKDELALFKAQQEAIGNGSAIETVETEVNAADDASAKAPPSGAKGDPKGTPKGASKTEDLGV